MRPCPLLLPLTLLLALVSRGLWGGGGCWQPPRLPLLLALVLMQRQEAVEDEAPRCVRCWWVGLLASSAVVVVGPWWWEEGERSKGEEGGRSRSGLPPWEAAAASSCMGIVMR